MTDITTPTLRDTDIAIIALAGRFPGADDPERLWSLLAAGREGIARFSDAELLAAAVPPAQIRRRDYVPAGGVLDQVAGFDAAFFGFTPAEATLLDPQQRLFLECAWEALERAGVDPGRYEGRIGVYAGAGNPVYLWENLLPNPAVRAAHGRYALTLATDKDMLTVRTAYKLGLRGPAVGVQTACSTSLVAVHLASQALIAGECDLALAGGVSLGLLARRGYPYEAGMILSPDGHCRAFDAAAAGTVPGSGVALVLLGRAVEALAAGFPIYAILRGSAINNDGRRKVGFTAPSSDGQAEVVREALALAGVAPDEIGLVEAHGTGTTLGDPVEVAALAEVFAGLRPGSVALGALKANLGHLDAAAGAAGLIKATLALWHDRIPPHPCLEQPNPKLGLDATPFYLNTTLEPWRGPRRAGVSAFGIGGTNAHVVLEQAPTRPARAEAADGPLLLPVAARSPESLERLCRALAERLEEADAPALADAAFTLAVGRRPAPFRRALVAESSAEACAKLRADGAADPAGSGVRVFFLFPGQGSQHPGMGRGLYAAEPVYRDAVDQVAALLAPALGLDLRTLLHPAPGQEEAAGQRLRETLFTQAALFATGWALAQLWRSWGLEPAGLLGHSIGELVAATVAGVLTLEEAAGAVAARAQAMQACAPGAMLSVPLGPDQAQRWLGPELELAVVEARRVVVGGPTAAIDDLAARLDAAGIATLRLRTSHAFHTRSMAAAGGVFTRYLAGVALRPPRLPFVSNLTGEWITAAQATDPGYWGAQLGAPVQLGAGLARLLAEPGAILLELGPGRSLGNAARQLDGPAPLTLASLPAGRDEAGDQRVILEAAGALWAAGADLDPALLHADRPRARVRLPTTPFERIRCWVEAGAADSVQPALERPGRFRVPVWRQLPLPRPVAERGGLLLLADPGPFATDLGARLAAAGWAVRTVTERAPEALEAALGPALAQGPRRVLVFAWDLEATPAADEAGGDRLLLLARLGVALARVGLPGATSLLVATRGSADLGADGPASAEDAALWGATRTLAEEIPQLATRCVDLPLGPGRAAEWADALTREAALAGTGELTWHGGRRWARAYEAVELPVAVPPAAAVVLITGGFGWLGRVLGAALARQGARLVLVGREALPPRDTWEALLADPAADLRLRERVQGVRELEAAGATVWPLVADVADPRALDRLIDQVQAAWGPIEGVIHAAGVPDGGLIHNVGPDLLRRALGPKVTAAARLAERLAGPHLRWLVLCSSLNAQEPRIGQFPYAAANAWLDGFGLWLRGRGVPAVSISWDTWSGGGMAVETHRRRALEAPLGPAIGPEEGVDALFRVLGQSLGHVLVKAAAASTEADAAVAPTASAPPPAPAVPRHPRPAALGPLVAPRDADEVALAAVWAEVLGMEVGVEDRLFDLGGDSLVAITLLARVNERLGRTLPIGRLFDAPTVAGMAAALRAPAAPQEERPACRARPERLPLSSSQARLWFLDRLQGGSAEYNLPNAFEIRGPLDADALEQALRTVQGRHEVLRTRIVTVEGEPCQVIDPEPCVTLARLSWEELTPAALAGRRAELLEQARRVHFDFAREAPLRATLARLGPQEHLLLLTLHHIAFDGWSMGVLIRELNHGYRRALGESLAPLAPLPLQVADHALRERERLAGAEAEQRRRWWWELLRNPPEPLLLPLGGGERAAALADFAGGVWSAELPAPLAAAVTALGHAQGCTPFMTFLAAYALLLRRCSGQEDLVVGTLAANRPDADLAPLIGFFVNTLALRLDLSGAPGFRELLGRVRSAALEAFARQDIPFDQVVSGARVEGERGATPLFDVLFDWQNAPGAGWDLPGLALRSLPLPHVVGRFQLSLTLEERGEGLHSRWEYDTRRLDGAAVQRLARRFHALLAAIVERPDAPVTRLSWMDAAERAELAGFGLLPHGAVAAGGLIARFLARAAAQPDAPAVEDGPSVWSYAQLRARAEQVCAALRQHGAGTGTVVGLLLERGCEQIAALLGVFGAGAALLPLDPGHPADRLAWMVQDSGARLVLTRPALAGGLPPGVDWLDVGAPGSAAAELAADPDPAARACILYTSGSTGRPKGVALPHRALAHFVSVAGERYGVSGADRVLQFAALTFDAAIEEIWPTLCAGATLVLRDEQMLSGGDRFWRACRERRLSVLDLPTAFWHFLCADLAEADPRLPAELRLVILGGERALPEPLRRWERAFAGRAALPLLMNTYGPTEATVVCTTHPIDPAADSADIPIGRPLPGVRVAVLDAAGEPVPPGVPGELYLGGPGLADGYVGRPDLSAERFVTLEGADGPWRAYRTGDRVCWRADGALLFRGRVDRQLKVRGHRVEPAEVEAVLLRAGVRAAAVDLREGAGGARLVAWVVPGPGAEEVDVLRRAVGATLPEAFIPGAWVFLPQLPLNAHGKVDLRALPDPQPERERAHAAPADGFEQRLAAIWSELLGGAAVGRDDDFFRLGGHSLLAFSLVARIEREFGRVLPLVRVFRSPTLAAQAALLREQDDTQELLVPLGEGTGDPPLFLIHPGGATLLAYKELVSELGRDGPRVLGIEARGFQAGERAHDDIGHMAACYLEALRAAWPSGPVRLVGWCFGGLVAYEMSRLLRLEGREVSLVAMIDTYRRGGDTVAELEDVISAALPALFGVTITREQLAGLDPEAQVQRAWDLTHEAGTLPPEFDLERMRRLLDVSFHHEHAAVTYYPAHNPGPITLIRARDDAESWLAETLGWEEFSPRVDVHWLPGKHLSLFHPPYVAELAEKIRVLLRLA